MPQEITPSTAAVIEARSLLCAPRIEERLEGIGRLCRIGESSRACRRAVAKALEGFIRERAPWDPWLHYREALGTVVLPDGGQSQHPPEDVQLALDTVCRWTFAERGPLDLSGTDLRGADLAVLDLEQTDFQGANLRGAALEEANPSAAGRPQPKSEFFAARKEFRQ